MFKMEGRQIENLGIILCDDDYLLSINITYLKHHYFTDIITFNLAEEHSKRISGEIYISSERVKENARIFNSSYQKELHRVIFHGILHLCGYKDKSKNEKARMRAREDHYLKKYLP